MQILALGSRLAPTLVAARTALPPVGAELAWGGPARRSVAPTLFAACNALPPGGAVSPWGGPAAELAPTLVAARTALPAALTCRRPFGFTLLELLVVVSIIAIASAGVSFVIRDNSQTVLEREGERLAALLEAGRALSRTSGQAVRWRDTPQGFHFEGANADRLPANWLSPDTAVQWDAATTPHVLILGPEPIIEAQAITLVQKSRRLRLATDGLRPFAVQTAP